MRVDEEYRGHKIRYRRKHGWIANIWPPLALFSLPEIPFASDQEGRRVVEERTRRLIDDRIATKDPGR